MGALPKQRQSRGRQGNRRRHHVLKLPQLMNCPQCGKKKQTHHVCMYCGYYKGRQVIEIGHQRNQTRDEE